MAKIQARNVEDALYSRIEQAAMRNERSVEGEIRLALAAAYPAADPVQNNIPQSMRLQWQQETGKRLQWLIQRLNEDGVGIHARHGEICIADYVRLGSQMAVSPGYLMDVAEGQCEMTTALATTLEKYCDVSGDWLMSGEGHAFPVVALGTYSGVSWETFFFPDDNPYVFEFIRIEGGLHDGTLLILRRQEKATHITTGLVTEAFKLCAGMENGGYSNLKTFLLFLKKHAGSLVMNAYRFTPPDPDFDFWSVIGQHHPAWFQKANYRTSSRWLRQLLDGEDPDNWFTGEWRSVPEEVAAAHQENFPEPSREGDLS